MYLQEKNIGSVNGWLTSNAVSMINCRLYPKKADVKGDSLEIGVDSGKSFILLASLIRENETILAVDVFEDQQLNKDQSGYGIRSHFELNIQAHLKGKKT